MAGVRDDHTADEWREALLASWGDDIWGTYDDVPGKDPSRRPELTSDH